MTRPRPAFYSLGLFGATVAILSAASCSESPDPCAARAMAEGKTVMSDTSTSTAACVGTVYLDSVGTDASGRVMFHLDSVGTDTT